jgi:hypothetical protein
MKRYSQICLLFFVLLTSPLAFAVDKEGNNAIGPIVGQIWPSGDIGKNAEGNVGYGLSYEYEAGDVFAAYGNWITSSHSDGNFKQNAFSAGIRSNLVYLDRLTPFAFLGLGLNTIKKIPPGMTAPASATLFGINLGVGADLDLNERFFFGLIFDLHNYFSKTITLSNGSRYEVSGRWAGLFLRGGVRF